MKKLLLLSGTILLMVNMLFTISLFGQTQLKTQPTQQKTANSTSTQFSNSAPQQHMDNGFFKIQREFNEYWAPYNVDNKGYYVENGIRKKAGGWKQFKRWEWFWENRIDPITGEFPTISAADVYEQQGGGSNRSLDGDWVSLGPNSSGGGYAGIGRLNCVVEQSVTSDLYAGAPSGGLWKSTDAGASWTVLTDDNAVLGVSSIVVVPTAGDDIIYIGTGDRDGGSMWSLNGGQNNDNNSIGVLKSTDGGVTWTTTGLSYTTSQKRTINRLVIDPNNSSIIYAATSDGIYKTTDGGTTWPSQILGSNFVDLEINPANSSVLYASTKTYGSAPVIYKTSNSGTNWAIVKTLLSTDYRVDLAVTAADSTIVYAIVAKQNGGLSSIQKSTDTGASFSQEFGSGTNMLGWYCLGTDANGQGGYDLCIAADPANANNVYIGGVNTWKSTDGGTSWTNNNMWTSHPTYNSCNSPVAHADKHDLIFFGATLYECNDGGLYKTTDGGTSWTDISNGMAISQLYRLSVAQTTSDEVMTGLQDNGSKLLGAGTWNDVQGGDGMECLIDYQDINDQYATYPQGDIMRTTARWSGSETDVTPGSAGDGAWVTPFVIDPNDHNTLYAGYVDLWKSTNQGTSWSRIYDRSGTETLRSLAVAPSNSNYIYTAIRAGIYRTTDGGSGWSDITGTLPVGSSLITYISVKDNDTNTVWVSMGEYNSNSVFETTDGGTTWTNISSGLPSIPVMCVIQNKLNTVETELYAATDVGIYAKLGAGDWFAFNNGLPNVVVAEIEIYYDGSIPVNSRLRAATFGRGLWESDLYTYPVIPPSITSVSPSGLYEDRGKQLTITGSDLAQSTFEIGGVTGTIVSNNGTTAIIDFLPDNYSNGTLTVTNAAGNDTYSITVSTRNTILVDASTGSNTDIHQTIDGAVDGLAAWYGSTAFNLGDLPGTKTIEVANGTYSEGVTLNSTLNPIAANLLIIAPASGAAPIVDASSQSYGFNLSTVDYVQLQGFTVHDALSDNIYLQGDNNEIYYNKLYNAGNTGVKVETGTNNTIHNNLLYSNDKYGMHVASSNNTIKNNTSADNGSNYSPSEQTLLDEGFEGAFLPTGWQQYGTGANSWVKGFFAGPILGPDGSANYAIHSWDANLIERSLETAGVNLSGYASASLEYYIYHSGTFGEIIYTEISTDGGGAGGTWVTLVTHDTDHGGWSPLQTTSLNAYAGNTIHIRFRYVQTDGNGGAVDVVKIKATPTAINIGAGLYVESGTGTSVQNNIFNAKAGNNAYYALISETGFTVSSDYNTYYTTNTNLFDYNGTVGNTGPMGVNDLNADPLFISSSDYHIFSTDGSYHGGEWPPLTASSGTWTNDASDSPAMDSGNPADGYSNEPESGGRINQGTYGNTAQASKSGSSSCTYPSNQATSFTATAAVESINVGWTRGNGNAVLVVARDGSAVNQNPADGTTYTANAAFGSGTQIGTGNYVVYDGTGTSVNVTGLTSGNTYHFAIYEYSSTGNCYLTPALTGNKTTLVPTVFAGDDATICEGNTYTISDADASDYTSLVWTTNGDGSFNNTTIQNPVYTPGTSDISAGSVTLTLTAMPGSISDDIVLAIDPESTSDAGASTASICYDGTYTASATATHASSILWTRSGDGSFTDATIEDAVYTPGSADIAAGTVTLTMTVTGACNSPSDDIVLAIDPESTVDAGASTASICYDGTYTASATATHASSILWTRSGDGSFTDATIEDAVYTPGSADIAAGTVTLTMTVTGACNSPSDDIVLAIDPESTSDAGASTASICYDGTYTASATATHASSILWTRSGDGSFTDATIEDAVYTPGSADIAAGTVTLTMTVTGACNSPSDDIVLAIDPESTSDAGASTASICYDGTYTASATATHASSILWTRSGDGSFTDATIEDAVYTPGSADIAAGTVTLTMTVTGACNSPSDDIVLAIDPESTSDAGASTASICYDGTYTASATATHASSILWTRSGDGSFTDATIEDAVYTPGSADIAAGTVTLTMTVTGACNSPSDDIVLAIDPESTSDAGASTASICYDGTYTASATATHASSILWTRSGDGSFTDATIEDAVYTPGSADIAAGTVTLTMTVIGACNSPSDDIVLAIDPESTSDAGASTASICYDGTYTASATATHASSILWTRSGDGSFTDATIEDAVYTPGSADIAAGTVTLTMTVTGACNSPSDDIVLAIDPESTSDAGASTASICYDGTYTASATATHASSILWTRSGDGSFTDATIEDAVYTPGSADIAAGTVTLTMTVTGACNSPSDDIVLAIDPESTSDAGASTASICYDGTYTASATATHASSILWTRSGDGSFTDATIEDAVYTPGSADIAAGTVTLTMTVTGACNSPSDDIVLAIDPESTSDAGASTASICYDGTYTASATATHASSILWTRSGDGSFTDATIEDAVYTPGSADIAAGTVTLTMTVTGACNSPSDDIVLAIDPESTSDAGASTASICYDGTYTASATATHASSILWTRSGDGSFTDATIEDAVYTPGSADIAAGTVTLTMTVTGACNSPSDDIVLAIDPESTSDAGASTASICYDGTYTASATATHASSILWTRSGDGSFTDATIEDAVYTPGSADIAAGTVTLTMTVTGACNSPSDDIVLAIDAESTVDAGAATASICYDGTYTASATATHASSILWTRSGDGSFTDATIEDAVYTPGSADIAAGTVTLTMTVTGACNSPSDDIVLAIDPESTSDAGASTASICYDGTYTASATATHASSILWTRSGDGSFTDATIEDAVYTPGSADIAAGTVTLTMTVTGACNSPSDDIVLAIDPESTSDAGASTASICYDGTYTASATATHASSILWTRSGDGSFTDATIEDAVYTPGSADIAAGTVTLTMTVTGACNSPSDDIVLAIDPESTSDAGASTASICYDGTYTASATATHASSILWTRSGDGSFTDATIEDAVYTPGSADIAAGTVTLTMTVTGACNSPSDDIVLAIDPESTSDAGASTASICYDGTYTASATATHASSILWTRSGDGSFTDATIEDAVYTPGSADIAAGTVTLTMTVTGACNSPSDDIVLAIDPESTVDAGASTASICYDGTYTASATATHASSILWTRSGDGSFTDATIEDAVYTPGSADIAAGTVTLTMTVTGACNSPSDDIVLAIDAESTVDAGAATASICYDGTYTASATATHASSILWTRSGDGSFTDATIEDAVYTPGSADIAAGTVTLTMTVTGACNSPSDDIVLAIDPESTSDAGAATASICYDGTYTASATATHASSILWTRSGDGSFTDATIEDAVYTPGSADIAAGTVTLTMTVTGACNSPSDDIVLAIDPESTSDAGASTASICYDGTYTASATATHASSILWTRSGDGSFTDATIEDAVYTPGSADIAAGTVTLTMTVTGACNSPSDDIVLAIDPESTVDAGASTASICYDGTYTASATATHASSILWTRSGDGSFTDATIEDAVYTPGSADIAAGTVTLTMTVTGACNSPSDDIVLAIDAESTVDAGAATASICYDGTYTASATATHASSILWTRSGDGSFTDATIEDAVYTPGSADIAAGTVTLTMTVTGACNSPSDDIVLAIDPESTSDAGASTASICYDGTYTASATATHASSILWTRSGDGSFTDATIEDAVYTPGSADIAAGTVTLTMTVTGACNSPSDDIVLAIDPESTSDAGASTASICYDGTYTASATATHASSILWTRSGDGSFTDATIEDAVYTPGSADIAAGTVTLTMTVTGACNSPSDDIVLAIDPESTSDAGASTASICYDGTYTASATATHASSILWTRSGDGSFTDATIEDAVYTPGSADIAAGTVTLTMTVTGACNSPSDDIVLAIDAESTVDAGAATASICYDGTYTASATATHASSILWTRSGDGSFTDATIEDAVYTPGSADIAAGTVTLTMTVTGACNSPSDDIVLAIDPESTSDAGASTASICYDGTYTASATATHASSILWTRSGDGSFTDATIEDAVYTPGSADIAAGTVTLTMTVTGACNSPSDDIVLAIDPESTSDAGASTASICYDGTYTASATATHASSILWTRSGDGSFTDATIEDAVYTPGSADIAAGTVTLTMTVTGACNSPSDDIVLAIDPESTSDAGASTASICYDGTYTASATATHASSILWTRSGDGSFTDATIEDAVYTPGSADIAAGTVTLTMTVTGACNSPSDDIVLAIDPESTSDAGASTASICYDGTYTASATATHASSILWTRSGDGSFTDATIEDAVYTPGSADIAAGTVTLTMTVTGACNSPSDDIVLAIDPESTSDAGASTASICYDGTYTASATATHASSILWTRSGDGSFTDATIEDAVYTPGSADIAAGTVTLTMTVTGACNSPSDDIVLAIDPESTSDAGAATASICYDGTYTASATATHASSILWTRSGDGSFTDATIEDAVYTPGSADIAAGTVTLTMTVTGACNSPSDDIVLAIDPESTSDAGASTASICYDGTYTASATATHASSILWTRSGDGSFTDATIEDAVYTPGSADIAAGTVTLTMTVTGACNSPSDDIVLAIDPESTSDAGASTASICYDGTYTASATATHASSILWTRSGDGSFTDATIEDAVYTPGSADIAAGTVTLTMTVTGACNSPSDDIVLAIDPESTSDAGASTASICYDGTYTASATATHASSILWTRSGDGSFTDATIEDAVYTPGSADIAAGTVTLTMTVIGACNSPSDDIVLAIDPESTSDAGASTASICYDGTYTASATATHASSILWTRSGDGSFTDATIEDAVYTPGSADIAAGTVTLTMTVTGACNSPSDDIVLAIDPESTSDAGASTASICYDGTYTASATATHASSILWTRSGDGSFTDATIEDAVYTPGSADIAAGTVTLTMTVTGACNSPSDDIVLAIDPESTSDAGASTASICYDGTYTASATATHASSILWTRSGDGSFTDATIEDAVYTPGSADIAAGTVTLTMTVTGACNSPSDDIVLAIDPESTSDAGASTASICYDGTYTASATATHASSILWTRSGDGSFTDATIEDAVYTPGSADIAAGTVTLTMTVTGACNSPSDDIVLAIDPESTSDAGASTASICYDGTYTASATATHASSILWTRSGDGSFTDATIEDAVYTPGSADIAAGTVTLTMTVTGACNSPSDDIVLAIDPESTSDAGASTASICYDGTYTASATATHASSILWTRSGDGSFTDATIEDAVYTPGSADIAAGTVTLTMTVIGACNSPSDDIVLAIDPESTSDAGASTASICYDGTYTASATATHASSILWTRSGDGSFTDATIEDAVYTPGSADIAAGTVTLTMTVTGACNSPSDDIVLAIDPESTSDAGASTASICYDGTYTASATATHASSILWTRSGDGSFTDATIEDAVYTPGSADIAAGTVTLTMTVTGACNSPSDDIVLAIDPESTSDAGASTASICYDGTYTASATATHASSILWTRSGDGSFTDATIEDAVYTPGSADIAAGTVTLTMTVTGACNSPSDDIVLAIDPESTSDAGASTASICYDGTYTASATATHASSILWTRSGDGSFTDATIEDAVYTPGSADIAAGTVTLTMTVTGACNSPSDDIVLAIDPESTSDAGASTASICYDGTYTASATATHASSILWTRSGDGSFTDATIEDAVYTPGSADIAAGTVTLTMTVTGACNSPSDDIVLAIDPESTSDAGASTASICYDGTYTASATATHASSILWTRSGDGSFTDATIEDAVYTPGSADIAAGTVTLTMTVTGACNSPSDDIVLAIDPESTSDAGASTASICYDGTYTASATATHASSILWTRSGDGSFTDATIEDAVYTPGSADIAAGTVTLTMTVTGACNSPSDDIVLAIDPESTSDAGASTASICYDGTYTASATATHASSILWTRSGDGSFTDATIEDAVYTPGSADIAAGTVTLTMTVTGACNSPSDDIVLAIDPESTSDAGASTASICYDGTYTASATATHASSILWTRSGDGSFTDATIEDAVYTPGSADIAAGTVTLTMTVTGACNSPSDDIVLAIDPESTSDAGASTASICYDGTYTASATATHASSILWTRSGDGSFTDATIEDAVYTPGSADIAAGTVTLTMTVIGACNSPSDDIVLAIDPESTSDAGASTASICYDGTYTASATATHASSILWTRSGDGSFTDATIEDAVYTPGSADIAAGTVTLTMTVTGACNSPSDDIVLAIDPESTSDAGASTASICYDGTYTASATATHASSILWTRSGDGSFTDATIEDAVYTPGSADIAAGTVTLTMTVTGACNSPSDDIVLAIDPESTSDAGASTASICYDGTYTASATATHASSILWTRSGDGSFTDATIEDAVYTPGSADIAAGTVTLTMTVTGACNSPSDDIVLAIDPESTVDAGASTASICYDGTYTASATATHASSILWTRSGDGSFTDATIEDAVYTPGSADIAAGTVTLTMTVTGACNSPSDDIVLAIDPESTSDAGASTASICYDGTYTASATATHASSILWTRSGDGSFTDATIEDAVYTPGSADIAAGTVTLTMTVTGACNSPSDDIVLAIDPESTSDAGASTASICYDGTYTASATATHASSILWTRSGDGSFTDATIEDAVYTPGSADIAAGTVTLTMTVTGACNSPSDDIVLAIDPESTSDAGASTASICYDGTYTASATATHASSILWTRSGDGSFTDATIEDAVYTPGSADIAAGTVTLTMTVTGACNSPSDDIVLAIDPESTVDAGASTASICYDGTYTASATATHASSILWTRSGDGSFTDATIEDAVYTPGSADIAAGTVTLTMTVTGACNSPSDDIVLAIDPESTSDAGASTASICYDGTYTASATATHASSILWTRSGDGSFTDATIEDAVYTPGSADIAAGTVTLTMTVTGACNSPSDDIVLAIDPESTVDAGASTASICYDGTYTASATATHASSILWTRSGDGSFTDATIEDAVYTPGSADIAAGTVTLTMTVTGACNSPSDDIVLAIDPESTSDAGASTASICYDGTYTASATATHASSILWTRSGDGSFTDATIEDAVYTPGSADIAAGTVTLTMTVTGACNSPSDDIVLAIDPESTSDAGASTASICYDGTYTASATATHASSILWTRSGDGSFTDATIEDAVYTPGSADIAAGTVTLTMTVTGACNSPSDDIVLAIDPESTSDAGASTASICYDGTYTASATATHASSILWTRSGDGSFTDATIEDAVYTPGSADIAAGTVTLTMTVTGACNSPSDDIVLAIDPESTSDAGSDASTCEGNSYTVNDATAANYTAIVWTHNGTGSLSDATTLTPTYNPGTGETGVVTLTMTVSGDCAGATDDMEITISPIAYVDAGDDGIVCESGSYDLNGSASDYSSILWSTSGDGIFEDPTDLNTTYFPGSSDINNGSVIILLTAEGIPPCSDPITDDMLLIISGDPVADAGEDGIVCENESYTLEGYAENYETILWSTSGDGAFDNSSIINATYTLGTNDIVSGLVILSLTAEGFGNCDPVSDNMNLEISYLPIVDAGVNDTICHDDSYVLSGFVENASDILWITAGDGNFDDPTLIDATYTPGEGDIFLGGVELTLTANASAPCNGIYMDDMFLTIEVCGYVSGNLFDNVEFKIAPNPANDVTRFYIENLNAQEVTIEFVDMKGSLISSENYQVINGKLEGKMILIGLEEGVYNIRAKAKGHLKTLRLIVTK